MERADGVRKVVMKRIRFAQRRRVVGLSQEALAEQLGVDRTTIIRWERGDNEPQPWQRPNIAMALKVSVEELDALLSSADQNTADSSADALSGARISPAAPAETHSGGALMRRQAVHPELLMRYETLTDTYRQMDYQTGSASVYAETITQLGRMMALADNVPSPLYQRFARALGDSAQLAAWLAIDRQDYVSARR
jgi:DNA-binding XRE family transcriptional regulator